MSDQDSTPPPDPGARPPRGSGEPSEQTGSAEDDAPSRDATSGSTADPLDLPWVATPERRDLWGPTSSALEGTVQQRSAARPHRPARRARTQIGVPLLLGGAFALVIVLLTIGGPALGAVAGAAVGLGGAAVIAGGSAAALHLTRPRALEAPTGPSPADAPSGTAGMIAGILQSIQRSRSRLEGLGQLPPTSPVRPAVERARSLLQRGEALAGAESLRARPPHDGELMMLEGITVRYLPELLDALEDLLRLLATVAGSAREDALENLGGIEQQLDVLGEGLEEIEKDLVAGVTRDLDVHAEFLRRRFAAQHVDPIIDV